jgi:hypothetical protein
VIAAGIPGTATADECENQSGSKRKGVDMDELIKQVAAKTGLGEAQARTAVETVVTFLKAKLPGPIAGQIDGLLGHAGTAVAGIDVGSVASGLGGLFKK